MEGSVKAQNFTEICIFLEMFIFLRDENLFNYTTNMVQNSATELVLK